MIPEIGHAIEHHLDFHHFLFFVGILVFIASLYFMHCIVKVLCRLMLKCAEQDLRCECDNQKKETGK